MKKLLIVAGIAGLAYYLKKNPKMVEMAKEKVMGCCNDLMGKAKGAAEKL